MRNSSRRQVAGFASPEFLRAAIVVVMSFLLICILFAPITPSAPQTRQTLSAKQKLAEGVRDLREAIEGRKGALCEVEAGLDRSACQIMKVDHSTMSEEQRARLKYQQDVHLCSYGDGGCTWCKAEKAGNLEVTLDGLLHRDVEKLREVDNSTRELEQRYKELSAALSTFESLHRNPYDDDYLHAALLRRELAYSRAQLDALKLRYEKVRAQVTALVLKPAE